MKQVRTIKPHPWMISDDVQKVMDALHPEGCPNPAALFVGGCVRNTLLNEDVADIDIATIWPPEKVQALLEDAGIRHIPTGIEHGTISAVINKMTYEITTLRLDVSTDGRHAVVAFTDDWAEDARRRDFTMNTLLADRDGHIYDPLGEGINDLDARRVIFVGDPSERIAEDRLRILRFFRFHGRYGQGEPDASALNACREAAAQIPELSKERITQEFLKILSLDDPTPILRLMFDHGVLRDMQMPETDLAFMKHVCNFQKRYGLSFISARLFVLVGVSFGNVRKTNKYLLLPKVFHRDMQALDRTLKGDDLSSEHAVKKAVYYFGRVPTAQALMIELAQDRVMNAYAPSALKIIQNWDIPNFPVSGHDLMQAGVPEGPELGDMISSLEQHWVEEDFQPNKKELLARLK